jgi:hypothetical protein
MDSDRKRSVKLLMPAADGGDVDAAVDLARVSELGRANRD